MKQILDILIMWILGMLFGVYKLLEYFVMCFFAVLVFSWIFSCFGILMIFAVFSEGQNTLGWCLVALNPLLYLIMVIGSHFDEKKHIKKNNKNIQL